MQTLNENKNRKLFSLLAVMCIGTMMLYAFYFNTFGSNASVMMDFFVIDNTQQGLIMTVQSVGALAAAVYFSLQGERFNKITVMVLGLLVMLLSAFATGIIPVFTHGTAGYTPLLIFSCIGGIGMTMIGVMSNGILSDVYTKKKDTYIPLMHAFYGAACMVIPIIITNLVSADNPATFAYPYIMIAAVGVVIFIIFSVVGKKIKPLTPYADMSDMKKRVIENPAEIFKTGTAWVILIIGALYFLFQIGMASWLPTYAINDLKVDYSFSGYFCTAFFAGQLVMRFLIPVFLKKMSPQKSFILFLAIGSGVMLLAFLVQDVTLALTLIVIGGFFQGGGGVLTILIACDAFPQRTASASALNAFSSGIASLIGPYIIGAIADASDGSFTAAMIAMVGCLAAASLMLGIYAAKTKKAVK